MLCPPEDILGFSPIQENKRSVQLMKIKECCTVESQECIAKGIYLSLIHISEPTRPY